MRKRKQENNQSSLTIPILLYSRINIMESVCAAERRARASEYSPTHENNSSASARRVVIYIRPGPQQEPPYYL